MGVKTLTFTQFQAKIQATILGLGLRTQTTFDDRNTAFERIFEYSAK